MNEENRQEKSPDAETPPEWTGTIQIKQTGPIQHQTKSKNDNRENYCLGLTRHEFFSILIQGGILFATSAYMVTAILQWCAMNNALEVTRGSLDLSRKSLIVAYRPWLSIQKIDPPPTITPNAPIEFSARIKNTGKSGAENIQSLISFSVCESQPDPACITRCRIDETHPQKSGTVEPDGERPVFLPIGPLTPEQAKSLTTQKATLYLCGLFKYKDAFPKDLSGEYRQKFCGYHDTVKNQVIQVQCPE